MAAFATDLQEQGYAVAPDLLTIPEIGALQSFFEEAAISRAERAGQTYGARNLLGFPLVRAIALSQRLTAKLSEILGPEFRVVRGLFFDKTEAANWPVLWHQDLSLAVGSRHDLEGWSNWSVKHGVTHVQPPAGVLARMVTVRLHLDDCPVENGALKVLPGSHANGMLGREAIREKVGAEKAVTVPAKAGDGLFMRPLLLHASSPAQMPRHRRVLHLEFAPPDLLPPELSWAF